MLLPEKTDIPFSKAKVVATLIPCLAAIVVSTPSLTGGPRSGGLGIFGLLLVCDLLLVYASAWLAWFLIENRPALEFSREGMIDRSYFGVKGFVPWSDVTAIDNKNYFVYRGFAFRLRNPKAHLARAKWYEWTMSWLELLNHKTPIIVYTWLLATNADEAYQIASRYFTASQESQDPENPYLTPGRNLVQPLDP